MHLVHEHGTPVHLRAAAAAGRVQGLLGIREGGGAVSATARPYAGALDHRLSTSFATLTEIVALLISVVIVLSMLGVNVGAVLLPAGVAAAFASRDLVSNFVAGEQRAGARSLGGGLFP